MDLRSQTPKKSRFDQVALSFLQRKPARAALSRTFVSLVSLRDEQTLTLQGKVPQTSPAILRLWVDDVIASAQGEGRLADGGQLEEIWGGRGWVVAWSRRAGVAAVIAQKLDSPGETEAFRATARKTVEDLGLTSS